MQYGRKNIQPPELPGGCDALPPPLDAAAEADALWRAQRSDEGAKMLLVEHNLCLVVHTARRFAAHGAPVEELISEGTIGLIKAVRSYDPARCIKLSTYATRCIENEMRMYFRRVQARHAELSLDQPLYYDGGAALCLKDTLPAEGGVSRALEDEADAAALRAAVASLDARDRRIISMRYGLDGGCGCTQKEAARLIGVTQGYISRVERRTLARLKAEILRIMEA